MFLSVDLYFGKTCYSKLKMNSMDIRFLLLYFDQNTALHICVHSEISKVRASLYKLGSTEGHFWLLHLI